MITSSVRGEVWRRCRLTTHRVPAALALLALLAGCERPKSGEPGAAGVPDTGMSGPVPARETTTPPPPDTQAAAATSAPAETSASRPAAPAPKPAAAPKPATDAPPPATARQDSGRTQQAAAPKQDTTTQTAEAPLRDIYHPPPRDTVDQATYDGWKQYNLNCARCHGEDVLGTTIAPHLIVSLKPDGPMNTKELFIQTVCAGRVEKGMPAWCALGMDLNKINDIYAYVKGRSEAKIGPGRPALKQEG